MNQSITMFIGLAVGFTVARLMNKGYEKTATAIFAAFALSLLCYMGWGLYQIWAE